MKPRLPKAGIKKLRKGGPHQVRKRYKRHKTQPDLEKHYPEDFRDEKGE